MNAQNEIFHHNVYRRYSYAKFGTILWATGLIGLCLNA